MKTFNYSLLGLGIFLFFACNSAEKQSEIPVIDVTKTYPEKKIVLQDIADVEYIPLETRDDVLLEQWASMVYVTEDTIIMQNRQAGDIFFFDGTGKFLHKFNRKGQSGEEYIRGSKVVFDNAKKEVFVYDRYKRNLRIQVYSDKGVYKRTLEVKSSELSDIIDYDTNHLLSYEVYFNYSRNNSEEDETKKNLTPFVLISKETGKVDTLKQFKEKDRASNILWSNKGKNSMAVLFSSNNVIPSSSGEFVLSDFARDTIFQFSKERKLTPICEKTPSYADLKQGGTEILTNVSGVSEKWLLLSLQPKEFDFENRKSAQQTVLLVDRNTNEIVTYKINNQDILDDDFKVSLLRNLLSSDVLIDLLEEGKLSGKLKEMAEKLTPDDNPVLVKVKFKE